MSDQLPTAEDLQKLSKRGMVCFAVRCAMRVVGLTTHYSTLHVLHEKSAACIRIATRFCLAYATTTINDAANDARTIGSDSSTAIDSVNRNTDDANTLAAIRATRAATGAARAAAAHNATYHATNTADDAIGAADAIDATDAYAAVCAARADYEKLLKLTRHQEGQLGDPIDPSENGPLGPLWPNRSSCNQADNPVTKTTSNAINSGTKNILIPSNHVSWYRKFWAWVGIVVTGVIAGVISNAIWDWFGLIWELIKPS